MYETRYEDRYRARSNTRLVTWTVVVAVLTAAMLESTAEAQSVQATAEQYNPSIIRKIGSESEKLEITTNSSRILTLDKRIPRVQVNNPELLVVTPLSDKQVQVSAKRVGITQINLWDEDGNIHTVDVLIYGDARELEHALKVQFPHSSLKVYRYTDSLVLKGFVDQPTHVSQIMRLAEDYAPKVINNITVGGVQQILLKVKVMEVSRTKLRDLGTDWAFLNGNSILAASNVSGLLQPVGTIINEGGNLTKVGAAIGDGGQTFQFGVLNGDHRFFGFLNALQQHQLAKTLADPNLVAVSGRPAQFQVGGEFPILIPQSLGTSSVEFKPYGTQVDFLPIVLGNGNIRLEVRPRISSIDPTLDVTISGTSIPALTVRQVDTAVEMKAGQTFALAGLIQEQVESQNTGLPFLSDMPILGVPFRRVRDKINEIELLILVTPEFVDAIDPCETPCGGPGYDTVSPTNAGLYCGGHVEVPAHCNPIRGPQSCNDWGCQGGCYGGEGHVITDGAEVILPGGAGYDDGSTVIEPEVVAPLEEVPVHSELKMPTINNAPAQGEAVGDPTTQSLPSPGPRFSGLPANGSPQVSAPRSYSPQRIPVYQRNAANPKNPTTNNTPSPAAGEVPSLIGPVGYDVQ